MKQRPSAGSAGHQACSAMSGKERESFNPMSKLCLFSRAPLTKYHRLSVLNNRNLLSHNPGSRKTEIKVSAEWFLLLVVKENLFDASLLAPVVC